MPYQILYYLLKTKEVFFNRHNYNSVFQIFFKVSILVLFLCTFASRIGVQLRKSVVVTYMKTHLKIPVQFMTEMGMTI